MIKQLTATLGMGGGSWTEEGPHILKLEREMKEKRGSIYLANIICQVYIKTVLIHKKLS